MDVQSLLREIVPADIFTVKGDTIVEQAQHLIDQCHPGATRMQVQVMGPEASEALIPYAQENRALHGFMHGGAQFSVGDTLTAIMCIYHVEKPSERMLTMDASIRYLRPVRKDTVHAKARLVSKEGKLLNFVCDFYNEENKRSAQAKYRYALVEPK